MEKNINNGSNSEQIERKQTVFYTVGQKIQKDDGSIDVITGEDAAFYYATNTAPDGAEIKYFFSKHPEAEAAAKVRRETECKILKEKKERLKCGDIRWITKEDILQSWVFDALYNEIAHEEHRIRIEYELQELAREYKVLTPFKGICAERQRRKKKEYNTAGAVERRNRELAYEQEGGHKTEFSDLPDGLENIYIGAEWTATDEGIYMIDDSGKVPKRINACSQPVIFSGMLKSVNGFDENFQYRLTFLTDQGWKTQLFNASEIFNANIDRMNDLGITLCKNELLAFSNAMKSMKNESIKRGAIKEIRALSSLGWNEDKTELLPYNKSEYAFTKENDLPRLMPSLMKPKGNRDEYYKFYKSMRQSGVLCFNFATAGAIASVILGFIGAGGDITANRQEGCVFDIYGDSKKGKSMSLKIAASMFGGIGGLVYSAKTTDCSMEVMLSALRNLPFFMDDTNNLPKSRQNMIPEMCMLIANGEPKQRSNKNLGTTKLTPWETCAIVTSEWDITRDATNAGSINRTYRCQGPKEYPKTQPWSDENGIMQARKIMKFVSDNYGWIGRDVVNRLLEIGVEGMEKRVDEAARVLQIEAEKRGLPDSQISNLALLMVADEIAEELIKSGVKLSMDELFSFIASEAEISANERLYEYIIEQMQLHPAQIDQFKSIAAETEQRADYREIWGVYEEKMIPGESISDSTIEKTLAISKEKLKEFVKEKQCDYKLFIESMRDTDRLRTNKNRNDCKVFVKATGRWAYMIKIVLPSKFGEYEREEETETDQSEAKMKPSQETFDFVCDDIPFPL